ncbi:MAG: hypothetical protein ACK5T6_14180 [Pirellula sp.]|jgi:hypothetical protein
MDTEQRIDFGEMPMATVEERLERLEKEVQLLKLSQAAEIVLAANKPGWVSKIEGSFKDAPEFAEIIRLGRDERQADILNDE